MATIQANTVRQYKDLDLRFTAHPVRKDVTKHVDEMAVINSLKNLILTNHYERPFQPEIGSNIQRLLFENMDNITASAIQREIFQTINNYEPRVVVESIQVSPNFDNNSYNIGMQFYIVNRTEPISIQFFLKRTR
jgi:phage baseplate assembly protein W